MFIPCAIGYGQIIGVKEFKDAVNKDYTAEDNKPGDKPGDKSDSEKTE